MRFHMYHHKSIFTLTFIHLMQNWTPVTLITHSNNFQRTKTTMILRSLSPAHLLQIHQCLNLLNAEHVSLHRRSGTDLRIVIFWQWSSNILLSNLLCMYGWIKSMWTHIFFYFFWISFLFCLPSFLKFQRGWWSSSCGPRVGNWLHSILPSTPEGRNRMQGNPSCTVM